MRSRNLFVCLLLCAALLALPQLAFADNAPTVTITFDKDTVAVGETVTATTANTSAYRWMAAGCRKDM